MALDKNIQPYISTFINSQFPRLYEEFGQPFIDFVTAYYQWMETQGPLFDSRRASDYQDIDTTVDKFLIYFKDKYLPNIQLETRSNVELLVKHSLDVYRSRGTIRAIDLLFRLVFGVGADVYYPYDDVFRLSSGDWHIPRYIEVSTQDDLNKFVGKEITGVKSGARAFVESWVRKKSGSKQLDILYISALEGNFVFGERINKLNSPFDLLTCPTMIGSLSSVNITSGGANFNIGDIIPLRGGKGYGGKGRVANVAQITGQVNFKLADGGYGYTANSSVLVSDEVLSLQNISPGANIIGSPNFFKTFETISQPMANINYQSAVGGYFVNNDIISTYYANGSLQGRGTVLAAANGSSTNGQIFVAVLSGNLQSNAIYNTGNAISASVPVSNGYNDKTATGNVMSESLYATVTFNNISGSFLNKEPIINVANTSGLLDRIVISGATASASVTNRVGVWIPGTMVTGQLSGATANLVSYNIDVGAINLTGTFFGDVRAPIITNLSGTGGVIPSRNRGSGATFKISPTLLYPETVLLNTDLIATYANTALSAPSYLFPAFPSANLATVLDVAFTVASFTVGRVAAISSATPGTGYTKPPLVRIFEPISFYRSVIEDLAVQITGATASFSVGDLVTQAATSARGLVVAANSSTLVFQKMSLINAFVPTSNSTTTISSLATGVTANVVTVADQLFTDPEDITQTYLGFNANVLANTSAANGTITDLRIISSGWGYEPGETLSITSANGTTASGEAVIQTQGVGEGFYRTEDGFVSGIKKIHDNDYYQVSSYDVRASVAFEHYRDMLKALLHVAGTRAFGTFVYRATASVPVNVRNAKVTQV